MNIILQNLDFLKNISQNDRLILIIYSLFPIFLVAGTAVSEFAIFFLVLKFAADFFLNKIEFYNKNLLKFLLVIYFTLLINLVFSVNFENSLLRNLFFIKYIIFTIGTINFFSKKKPELFFVFKIWILIFIFFSLDLIFQFITGKNIIGIVSPQKPFRLSGFMRDELKAGALILSFCFTITGFLISKSKYKNYGLILLFLFLITIFLTGDRSNFLKSILVMSFLFFFIDKRLIKKTIVLFLMIIGIALIIVFTNDVFKARFKNQMFNKVIDNNFNLSKAIKDTEYGKIYTSSFQLFLTKKIVGVGNKNYRILCDQEYLNKYNLKDKIQDIRCNTHPHQIYFEILSEHGILGFLVLMTGLLFFGYKNFLLVIKKKDYLLTCIYFSILAVFVPLLPGGSFFTSFNASMFWLNISIFYSYKNICIKNKSI